MFRQLKRHATVWWALLGDRRTPFATKALPWAALAYFLLPIDLIPDFLPLIGQLDDVGMVIALLTIAFKMIPRDVWHDYERKTHRNDVIDV